MSDLSPTPSLKDPLLAGRFRLFERLGAGGMGDVWSAEHLASGEMVAVKLLREESSLNPGGAARFEVEARTLSRIQHPNVVKVVDFGRDKARGWFLAVELVKGETLQSVLEREKRLSFRHAAQLTAQILSGLAAVHEAGVVHRDLKPENVMLEDEGAMVRLLDFGIAKLLDPAHRVDLTVAGQVFGTPAYLSPEQALGKEVDARADLYSCGVILHRAVLGRLPFEAETATAMALRHAVEPLPPLPDEIPGPLAAVIEMALAKEPDDRYPDAESMRAALLEAAAGLEAPEPVPVTRPIPLPLNRAVGTGAVPRSQASVSRTVVAIRLLPKFHPTMWDERNELPPQPQDKPVGPMASRDVIDAFAGRVVKVDIQDLSAEFTSPTDALQAAAAVHDRLAQLEPETSVHIAVTAGEVLRQGRSLKGEPVKQANLLLEVASAGEVLFTHGVYLAMTRSEVDWEPWPGRDPGLGQKLYRLKRPVDVIDPELPYGGNTLDRALAVTPKRVMKGAGRLAEKLARRTARGAAKGGKAMPPALRRLGKAPWAALAILGLVVGGATAWRLSDPWSASPLEVALTRGDHEQALQLARQRLADDPADREALAAKGRAFALAGRHAEAQAALDQALGRDPTLADRDPVARAVVRAMDRKGADSSLATRFRTRAMERALVEATGSIRYWERWNATRTLEKFGLTDRIDWVAIYLLDLQHAGSCGTRVKAARELGKLQDPRAVEPLLEAKSKGFDGAACNLKSAAADALVELGEG